MKHDIKVKLYSDWLFESQRLEENRKIKEEPLLEKFSDFAKKLIVKFKKEGKNDTVADLEKLAEPENVEKVKKTLFQKGADFAKNVKEVVKRESRETKQAAKILMRMIRKEEVSDGEKKFLKQHAGDLAKVIPLVAISGIPVPFPITPLLIVVGKKYGFNILPRDQEHLLEEINEDVGVHEYGCAMLYYKLPEMKEIHESIDENDIYHGNEEDDRSYGLEKEAHTTLLYGLHDDEVDPEKIMETCVNCEYPNLTLMNVSTFENDKYDVLKFDVKGDILHELNGKLTKFPHTTDYPDYHPHSTIAYLKKGEGKKYVEMMEGREIEVEPDEIVYSRPDGTKVIRKVELLKSTQDEE